MEEEEEEEEESDGHVNTRVNRYYTVIMLIVVVPESGAQVDRELSFFYYEVNILMVQFKEGIHFILLSIIKEGRRKPPALTLGPSLSPTLSSPPPVPLQDPGV